MQAISLITDDRDRSVAFARDLDTACRIHDLHADMPKVELAKALVVDVADLGTSAIKRIRYLVAQIRWRAPVVVLLHQNCPRQRLQAIALGATLTLSAPFDQRLLRAHLCLQTEVFETIPFGIPQRAEAGHRSSSAMFGPSRPIIPVAVDTGTDLVEQVIQEDGTCDWIRAVRQFDDTTHRHCMLVAGLTAAFAASLNLSTADRRRVIQAALLHDVGKIHIPTVILNKPGKLDPDEMELVRLHPSQGQAMLAYQGLAPEVLTVVRSHHEMLDGSGYPDGLAANAIPDLVRIVTVCDIFGALIERRPYKAPMTSERAYAILVEMKGRLDPVLVDAFQPVCAKVTPAISGDG